MTYYNNANGSSAGSSYRTGNTTYYNNANGSSAGRSTTMGNTTYYYNANGSAAGSSTRMGNTTYLLKYPLALGQRLDFSTCKAWNKWAFAM